MTVFCCCCGICVTLGTGDSRLLPIGMGPLMIILIFFNAFILAHYTGLVNKLNCSKLEADEQKLLASVFVCLGTVNDGKASFDLK
jgi:hypothetical protein